MKDALLLHLDPAGDGAWSLATDHLGNGIGAPRHRALAELAADAAGRRVIVLLPAERTTLLDLRSPVRERGQFLRALPALVEDRLAADVERFHLSAGPIGDDGSVRVVAVEHAEVERVLARLREAGLDPEHLIPDACCLPGGADAALALLGERVLLRAPLRAAALGIDAASVLLQDEALPAKATLWIAGGSDASAERLRTSLAARGISSDERVVAPHELERILLRGAAEARVHDLRFGRHRRSGAAGARWRPWRLAASFAALWLGVSIASAALEVVSLWRERSALRAQLAALLPEVAPEAVGQPDPLPYLENRLRGPGAARGGVSLDDVVRAASALRGIGGAELTVIDARGGVLELGVRAADLAALEAARGAVSRAIGRAVELRGASSDAGHAEARLALVAAGSG